MQIHRTSFLDIKVTITWPFTTDSSMSSKMILAFILVIHIIYYFSVQGHNYIQCLSLCHSPGPWKQILNALAMSSYPMLLGYYNTCNMQNVKLFETSEKLKKNIIILSHFRALILHWISMDWENIKEYFTWNETVILLCLYHSNTLWFLAFFRDRKIEVRWGNKTGK